VRADLPTGTVTFLFTDIEGSTRLLRELGDAYADVLSGHHRALRDVWPRHGGFEVDTQGDAFFVAFERASDAVSAASAAHAALEGRPVQVRIGLHTGEPLLTELGYVGHDVHRAARIAAAGHGGQTLLSRTTHDLVDAEARDLGEHRLKDLSAPERIFQLGVQAFPPLMTLRQTNLPVLSTPLLGRDDELADISRLVRGGARILTLTGVGGIGKTRLALQAAAELSDDYPDGLWFVPLAAVSDATMVESAIAQAVRAHGDLSDFLGARNLLLVLDNVEQLMPDIAAVVAALPAAAVVVTSRERLGLHEEQEVPVAPLPLDASISLFVDRARRLIPSFQPDEHVATIVRRLDGLPLAIELAAARIKLLAPAQIEQRLARSLELLTTGARDVPERQRTLRATIVWSYDLLHDEERRALRALAVFRGGFTVEAAEDVAQADIETIARLVDKSLVARAEPGRLFLLATIREFLLEQLVAEIDEVAARHAAYYERWLPPAYERWLPASEVYDQKLRERFREVENIRALVDWMLAHAEAERALSTVARAAELWTDGSNPREPWGWLSLALERSAAPSAAAVHALTVSAVAANQSGEHDVAVRYSEGAIALATSLGETLHLNTSLAILAIAHAQRGDRASGRRFYEEALALERRASTLHNFGTSEMWAGDLDRAAALLEESLEVAASERRLRLQQLTRHSLGDLALHRGDTRRAKAEYRESLRIAADLNVPRTISFCAGGLAAAAALEGDAVAASRLWGLLERLEDEHGRIDAIERSYYLEAVGEIATEPYEETRHVSADEAVRLVNAYVHSI
jgi:predicted ATPase/Tfp pilus assembly protein PilF